MRKMIAAECQDCKHVQDELVEEPLTAFGAEQEFPAAEPFKCEACAGSRNPIRKPNGYGLDFRGGGFYVNDYNGRKG